MAKGLSTERIVDAAFVVLDEVGIDGLTTRAVADRLGVRPPALYWHLRDKRQLVDEMGTRVWREISSAAEAATGAAASWEDAFRAYARATRHGLLAHRDGARLFSGTYLTDAGLIEQQEPGLAWLADQGFGPEAATDAFTLVTSFAVGYAIEEQERRQADPDRYAPGTRESRVDPARFPLVTASGRRMFADPDGQFETLLEAVVTAVATLRHR